VRTAGPFTAVEQRIPADAGLVEAGLPFLQGPVRAEATIRLDRPAAAFRFAGVAGDALRVSLDGRPLGWAWGPDWSVAADPTAAAGEHRLRVDLFPSTFNHFGPHHYCAGDWHVVSPGQMVGAKNFADPDDAPDSTHVAAWHFKPLRLPRRVGF